MGRNQDAREPRRRAVPSWPHSCSPTHLSGSGQWFGGPELPAPLPRSPPKPSETRPQPVQPLVSPPLGGLVLESPLPPPLVSPPLGGLVLASPPPPPLLLPTSSTGHPLMPALSSSPPPPAAAVAVPDEKQAPRPNRPLLFPSTAAAAAAAPPCAMATRRCPKQPGGRSHTPTVKLPRSQRGRPRIWICERTHTYMIPQFHHKHPTAFVAKRLTMQCTIAPLSMTIDGAPSHHTCIINYEPSLLPPLPPTISHHTCINLLPPLSRGECGTAAGCSIA